MLTYVNISLFESPAQTLVNTVNTVGVMGKGIALMFKQLYPEMYQEYRRLCQAGKLDIGKLYIYRTPNKIVVNFPTKKHWRQPSQISYIESGLRKFVEHYMDYGISSVSFPQLGCGNGELDWERQVKPIMEEYLRNLPIPVYIHLYGRPAAFVPERLNVEYAREMRLERQRVSIEQLWKDLTTHISGVSSGTYLLSLFGPAVEIDGEHVIFRPTPGEPVIVYREDIEDIWNTLRSRGTIKETEIPQAIREAGASGWLFDLLQGLEYVRPIALRSGSEEFPIRGLRYVPLPERTAVISEEILA
jgi:O-acetyl-ADP-ribose deacetylase (regulator of RNase III)